MTKTATVQAQQRWEYLEVTRKTETYLVHELNELGTIGWDLVSASFHKDTRPSGAGAQVWTAFLKRPLAGHVPSAAAQEKTAAGAPAAAPAAAPANRPGKLMPSTDTGDDFEFAEEPAEEPADEPAEEEPSPRE